VRSHNQCISVSHHQELTATHCNALQLTVTQCNSLHNTAIHCSALTQSVYQCITSPRSHPREIVQSFACGISFLQSQISISINTLRQYSYGVATIIKLQVSFAKEPYKRDVLLQKRPIIWRSLLIVATPYRIHIQYMDIYGQLQIGWHRIWRLFLKTFNLVPGVPKFSWDL